MSNNFPEGLKLPNELERRQMFYQLKKESSFTAWNRMLELYQAWADVTERSVREADAKGWLEKKRHKRVRLRLNSERVSASRRRCAKAKEGR
ncbi:hypothetical protein GDR29_16220 [Xanthomonas oryzae pv. oryzae]|nr:hypothetical protein GDR29_16220 [Xanthomonas oryzae pv. oryzae]